MNNRVSWIEHKGARILYADYSNLSGEEYIGAIEEFKNELLKQTPGSIVTLTNVTDSKVTNEVKEKLKELRSQTKGISKKAAAIGMTGFKKAIAVFIRKDLYWADSLEEAKEWLTEQSR